MNCFSLYIFGAFGFLLIFNANGLYTLPLPAQLIPFNTTEGAKLFEYPTTLKTSFYNGFQHLTTQRTQTFCSIATSVTILNAIASDTAPIDPQYDPYPYWTQRNFFSSCTAAVVSPVTVSNIGSTIDQLGDMLACYNIDATVHKANTSSVEEFRRETSTAMSAGNHIAINFYRTEIGETGGGHFSPILAYSADADMVLLADVARYKYPPAWVPVVELFDAMLTIDNASNDYRGFIVAHKRQSQ